jgi:flagellar biosynthesis protein FlhA
VASQLKGLAAAGHPPVIVASPQVRAVVRQIIAPTLPDAAVLGYNEVADDVDVESIGLVKPPQTAAAAAA